MPSPIDLRHFSEAEFRSWWSQMSVRLLVVLDVFRSHWGDEIAISPAQGALGRRLGKANSQHNVDKWGEVRAADLMPRSMKTVSAMLFAVRCAKEAGATGIGVYPFWHPRPGLHLDVRTGRNVGDPALWGAVLREGKQVYVGLQEALDEYRRR